MRSLRERLKRKTELLSPAGSYDSARAAVNAGADAIYMGGPLFSARAFAESSAEEMLLKSIEFCHMRGVRVFMTLNTLLKDSELKELQMYLKPYHEAGLDGVIVQDLGVMHCVRELYPDMELHISTQAAVTGWRTAKRFTELGAKRIVLARELSLDEIRNIRDRTGAELEVFAHGALCYSYSGNCLMSSFIGGRSGNRGKCAGTCRLPFEVEAAYDMASQCHKAPGSSYLLSMCDLNTVNRLREMIDAGVYSFKIEGRMKSAVYTAAVTSVYRKYLDIAEQLASGQDSINGHKSMRCIEKTGEQLALGQDSTNYINEENVTGKMSVYYTSVRKNDETDHKPGRRYSEGYKVSKADISLLTEVFDRTGFTDGYLDGRNGADMLTLKGKPEFRSRDDALIEDIKRRYIDNDAKLPVSMHIELIKGQHPVLSLSCIVDNDRHGAETDVITDTVQKITKTVTADGQSVNETLTATEAPDAKTVRAAVSSTAVSTVLTEPSVTVSSDLIIEKAGKQAATADSVREKLSRLGGTDFELAEFEAVMEDDCFVPVSTLNELRRAAADELKRHILNSGC